MHTYIASSNLIIIASSNLPSHTHCWEKWNRDRLWQYRLPLLRPVRLEYGLAPVRFLYYLNEERMSYLWYISKSGSRPEMECWRFWLLYRSRSGNSGSVCKLLLNVSNELLWFLLMVRKTGIDFVALISFSIKKSIPKIVAQFIWKWIPLERFCVHSQPFKNDKNKNKIEIKKMELR